ncbi:hypothetical protein MLD38_022754 [Melastoma candidum]|uniref:Uncharacterized protein n=1 Tax=Melastoma candidum TaxID=119954 RepID=A0ACB9QK97_9MYRT|nr:hypothetical protein MLD38_022754 [Melastoma candidum]
MILSSISRELKPLANAAIAMRAASFSKVAAGSSGRLVGKVALITGHNLVVDGGFTCFKNLSFPNPDQFPSQ